MPIKTSPRLPRRVSESKSCRMSAMTLKAHYDGAHIVLDEPFDLPANAVLAVTVLDAASARADGSERDQWSALSAQGLARAYGDDEPEYSLDDLKP